MSLCFIRNRFCKKYQNDKFTHYTNKPGKKLKKQFSTKLVILLMSFTTSLTNFKLALS